ncbi:MAG: UDP-N-acetylmuramoyl-tripeptide--D-alanyl-D-alanine ligase [Gemmatimonadaceae bacterium]|nr:UDP-N-acetylmuramoyl-tripeptide--D-alanyl-D-alanine ligase [Gemmatimonadaceae bacterium]
MTFWSLARVAAALELPRWASVDAEVGRIWTDTRTLQPGDVFVALKGERFDAHDYLPEAVAAGVRAVVVHDAARAAGLGVPVFEVADTLHALGALGRYRRRAWPGQLIAVGGSNGKTSTKELLRAALAGTFTVHATTGNLNNQIGVPLTLLALDDAAEVAIVEVGTNEPGEIALLRAITEPDLAVVTCIQEEHLEGFGSLEGVLAEEVSLLDGITAAVVPADDAALVSAARARAATVITAGLEGGDVQPTAHGSGEDGRGWVEIDGTRVAIALYGAHNRRNAMLALAVAQYVGAPLGSAAAGLAAMTPPSMRSAVTTLGEALLINDAYNANPGSMRAALALLADVAPTRQRVAVLGTMRELGHASADAHRDIARAALASGAQVVAGIGDFRDALAEVGGDDPRIVTAADVDDLWPRLAPRLERSAAILLKASRGVRLERLLPHLTDWAR